MNKKEDYDRLSSESADITPVDRAFENYPKRRKKLEAKKAAIPKEKIRNCPYLWQQRGESCDPSLAFAKKGENLAIPGEIY